MPSLFMSGANILDSALVQTNTGAGNEGQGTITINGGTPPFEADDFVVFDVQNTTVDGELDGASGVIGAVVYDSYADFLNGAPKYTYTPMNPGQEATIQNDLSGLGDSYARFNANVLTSSDPGAPALAELLLTPQTDWFETAPTSGVTIDRFTDHDFNDSGAIEAGTTEDSNGLFSVTDWNAEVLAASDTRNFIVDGTSGADTINAGYTDDPDGDRVDANDAADGSNDDVIDGGAGDDLINAGAGDDTIIVGDGSDTVDGGDGYDVIDASGADEVTPYNVTFSNIEEIRGSNFGDTWFWDTDQITFIGGTGNDSVTGGSGADDIFGGDGDDTIFGGAGNDSLTGSFGNDTLSGDAGNDTISGGVGDDSISGGAGNDLLLGTFGNNTISGGAGDDRIFGSSGNDSISGGDDNDSIWGGDGDDTISGGAGDDTITAGAGNDTVTGGTGSDTYVVTAAPSGAQTDVFDGGEDGDDDGTADGDIDILDLSALTLGVDYTISYTPVGGAVQGASNPGNASQTSEDGVVTFSDGSTLTFSNVERVICFTRGTRIQTDGGAIAVEHLAQGDRVLTHDHGYQPIRWIGSILKTSQDLASSPNVRPIRITAGALGCRMPSQDLLVSPQHRMLVRSRVANRMFGEDEVLVAAQHLVGIDGIDIATDVLDVEYFHLLFDQHEIVTANGALSESLFTGPEALGAISTEARTEIFKLFPELMDVNYEASACRTFPNGRKARKLASRHMKNNANLVQSIEKKIAVDLRDTA